MLSRNHVVTALAFFTLFACASPLIAEEQRLPATPHQDEASRGIDKKAAPGTASAQAGMASSKHQEEVLRQFAEADTNRDGSLSKDEYAAYMENRAARAYWGNMQAPEDHGTETAGPRDRTAADADEKPVAGTGPTVNE